MIQCAPSKVKKGNNMKNASCSCLSSPLEMSHNACYAGFSCPRISVSYFFSVDCQQDDFLDVSGEFGIIDPSFDLQTYGNHLLKDKSFLYNYLVRRCFCDFDRFLPLRYDGLPHSYSVLSRRIRPNEHSPYEFVCRCLFDDLSIPPITFSLSFQIEDLRNNNK